MALTREQFNLLRAIDAATVSSDWLSDYARWYHGELALTPEGRHEEQNARDKFLDISPADKAEFRILKRVNNCRRANPHLTRDQAIEVVLAASNMHRDDQLRELQSQIARLMPDGSEK